MTEEQLRKIEAEYEEAHSTYAQKRREYLDARREFIAEHHGIKPGAVVKDRLGKIYKVAFVEPSLMSLNSATIEGYKKLKSGGWGVRSCYVGFLDYVTLVEEVETAS